MIEFDSSVMITRERWGNLCPEGERRSKSAHNRRESYSSPTLSSLSRLEKQSKLSKWTKKSREQTLANQHQDQPTICHHSRNLINNAFDVLVSFHTSRRDPPVFHSSLSHLPHSLNPDGTRLYSLKKTTASGGITKSAHPGTCERLFRVS